MPQLGPFQPDWIICTDPKQLRNADVRKYVSVNAQLLSRQQRGKTAGPKRLKDKLPTGSKPTQRRRPSGAIKTAGAKRRGDEIGKILKIPDHRDSAVSDCGSSPGSSVPSLSRTDDEAIDLKSAAGRSGQSAYHSDVSIDDLTTPLSWSSGSRMGSPPMDGPHTLLDSGLLDPFQTGIVPISRDMNDLLLHLFFIMVPPKKLCEKQPWNQFCPVISMWARTAIGPIALPEHYLSIMAILSSPMLQYAVCSLASAHSHFLKGHINREFYGSFQQNNPFQHRQLLVDCLYYQGKTMSELHKHLADKPDHADLLSVVSTMCLLVTAVYFGFKEDILVHINGIKNLISYSGGWELVPYDVAQIYLTTIYLCCIWTASVPPPPLSTDVLTISTESIDRRLLDPESNEAFLPNIGNRLLGAADRMHFDDEMLDIFEHAQYITRYREFCLGHPDDVSNSHVELYTSKRLELEYLLMVRLFTPRAADSPTMDRRHISTQLALLAFSLANLELLTHSSGPFRTLTTLLKASLVHPDLLVLWYPNWDILMWVLFMGIHITGSAKERTWYLARLGPLLQKLGLLQNWQSVRVILADCFYVERIYGEEFETVWRDAGGHTMSFDESRLLEQ